MKVVCTYCRKVLKARVEAFGQKLMCPSCELIFKLRRANVMEFEPGEENQLPPAPPSPEVFRSNSDTHFGMPVFGAS